MSTCKKLTLLALALLVMNALQFSLWENMACAASAADGVYEILAKDADLSQAPDLILEPESPPFNLGGWKQSGKNTVFFPTGVKKAGKYQVTLVYSREPKMEGMATIGVSNSPRPENMTFSLPSTGSWANYKEFTLPLPMNIPENGILQLVTANPARGSHLINLRAVKLRLEGGGDKVSAAQVGAINPAYAPYLARLDKMGFTASKSLDRINDFRHQVLVYKNSPIEDRLQASGEYIEVILGKNYAAYDYSWDEGSKSYNLTHYDDVLGSMRLRKQGDTVETAIAALNKETKVSGEAIFVLPSSVEGLKICEVPHDGYAWGLAGTYPNAREEKLKILAEIIAVWKKYDEKVSDPKLLTPEGLMDFIETSGKVSFALEPLLFPPLTKAVGLDPYSYYYERGRPPE